MKNQRKHFPKTSNSSIRKLIEMNIHAHNKIMTPEVLENYNLIYLLRLTHPLNRNRFAMELYDNGMISIFEKKEFSEID